MKVPQVNKYGDPVELAFLTEEVYKTYNAAFRIDEEQMKKDLQENKYYHKLADELWMYSEDFVKRNGLKYNPPT
jgi:hypothetical protein